MLSIERCGNLKNIKIRVEMTRIGLKQWEVAKLLGISESVFSRKLRNELPEAEQERIITLIHNSRK